MVKTTLENFGIEIDIYLCMNRHPHDTHTSSSVDYLVIMQFSVPCACGHRVAGWAALIRGYLGLGPQSWVLRVRSTG